MSLRTIALRRPDANEAVVVNKERTMDRVLGLQALTEFSDPDPVGGCSTTSGQCSSSSGAGGDSGCSIGCSGSNELDW